MPSRYATCNRRRKKRQRPQQPRRQTRRRRRQRTARAAPASIEERAVTRWAVSTVTPWHTGPVGLPHSPGKQSVKYQALARGEFAAGATGFGFIATRAEWANDAVLAADSPVYASGNGYASDTILPRGTDPNSIYSGFPNAPYSSAAFGSAGNQMRARVVHRVLRIRYTGTNLNKGGRMVGIEHPSHDSLVGLDYNTALSYRGTHSVPVSDSNWHTVAAHHLDHEVGYHPASAVPAGEGELQVIEDNLAFLLRTTPGNLFEYEYWVGVEAIGAAAGAFHTRSPVADGLMSSAMAKVEQLLPAAIDKIASLGGQAVNSLMTKYLFPKNAPSARISPNYGTPLIEEIEDTAEAAAPLLLGFL